MGSQAVLLQCVVTFCKRLLVHTMWAVLRSIEVLVADAVLGLSSVSATVMIFVVGAILVPSSVSATIMGYVGATHVASLFPLLPDLVRRTFLFARSCLAPVGSRD